MIEAAVAVGKPPTAMIFSDPTHVEWTVWDYRLVKAHFMLKNWYRDGVPIWWDESDRVTFDAKSRVSKSRAAIDRAQTKAGKSKNPTPGQYFIAEPRVMDGGEMPTRDEWVLEQKKKSPTVSPVASDDKVRVVQGR
tara:strand:+ start:3498 stop:3905 length:408 start_codon:yes stop_codon:yes gene_type:complete